MWYIHITYTNVHTCQRNSFTVSVNKSITCLIWTERWPPLRLQSAHISQTLSFIKTIFCFGGIFHIGCRHGYLFACATAWCYVHGPILKSPISRGVCTVAGANVVQLWKYRDHMLEYSLIGENREHKQRTPYVFVFVFRTIVAFLCVSGVCL